MQLRRLRTVASGIALLMLAACGDGAVNPAPPRVTTPAEVPKPLSRITVPVSAPVADLERLVNAQVPKSLLSIDRQEDACIPAAKLTVCLKHKQPCKGEACKAVPCAVGFQKAKIIPSISCRIVGEVTRGPIRLTGKGDVIQLRMPVQADIRAQDVGKIIRQETATAAAEVRATIALGLRRDWQPTARVDIDYNWTQKPGIDILGKRITFAGKADPKLQKVISGLEAELPNHLVQLGLPKLIAGAWEKGFTSVSLNRQNPEVWMRITPQRLGVGGYRIEGDSIILTLGMEAMTETFLGNRPPDPDPIPLPPQAMFTDPSGLRFHLPVVADYAELEPVLEKALRKLASKPIMVPVVGEVNVAFGKPTIYTTAGDRLAIGLPIEAGVGTGALNTKGVVWLTGKPWNAPNSQKVLVQDLQVAGKSADLSGNLLIGVARSPAVTAELETAIAQNFDKDLAKLMVKIHKALADKQVGDFQLSAEVTEVRHGVVTPVGQGLYLPVEAFGRAQLRYRPREAVAASRQTSLATGAAPAP